MQDEFAQLLSRFDELTESERSRLDQLAQNHADRRELIAFARQLFRSTDPDNEPSVSQAKLVEYVLATRYGLGSADLSLSAYDNIRFRVESDPVIKEQVEGLFARLDGFDDALPPVEHFERLTGISVDESKDKNLRGPVEGSIVREPSAAPSRAARSRTASRSLFRRRTIAMVLPIAIIAFIVSVSGISRATTPDVVNFVRTDLAALPIAPAIRSSGDREGDPSRTLRLRLSESISTTVGLFPRIDRRALQSLDADIQSVLDSSDEFDLPTINEVRLLKATTQWALGNEEQAVLGFEQLQTGAGDVSLVANSALASIHSH